MGGAQHAVGRTGGGHRPFHANADPDETRQVRAALDVAGDQILLLYVGRLAPEKNVTTLFDAFAQLEPARFALVVVGDGSERRHLARLREGNANVHWLPYQGDGRQLARLYRAADLFVHPGVQETFGLVALESQGSGTPVVGIRGSYMDRIIFTDQKHWAAENSPSALAEAIRTMARRDLATEGRAAAARVHQFYGWDRVFERLFGVYAGVARR